MTKKNFIELRKLVNSSVAFGNQEGREVYQAISMYIDENPDYSIFEVSLRGIDATDASFPRESIVSIAKNFRGEKAFYLTNFKNKDLIDNWQYGAEAKEQPLLIHHEGKRIWIGPKITTSSQELLDYIYEQPKVTTSLIANHFDISIPNASMKLKKLFNQGYILGEKETASSGGHEFVYRAIKE
ncbi:DNA-binding protein [Acinetobacter baumannii]|uniref:DNA-binding protein n=1 Tax=Acinetobacter calcoaceticus/baumannii complex TaxID=909768 RepID=UPI001CDBF24D|nr:DNA-binding protein [Acinetobacter baumannii]MCA4305081.1 DNA-binding protein [Acinetobacter baumannii]MDC4812070.1 DNA-binding protein [Acinetobacter baumannii]MDO7497497.1 DNA-binding protein [Acinetobacter baumannii]MDV7573946.1 DNA-binding protein [Acinetobacter baumannii]